MSDTHPASGDLYDGIREILVAARGQVQRSVNQEMVQAYWNIGRLSVEPEQGGEARAEYGKRVLETLSERLKAEFGPGFSVQGLWNYRLFHQRFPILSTAWRELGWSHFRSLMRIENPAARHWYADEAARYSALGDNPHLFASKYRLLLPSEAELRAELERDRALLEANTATEGGAQ